MELYSFSSEMFVFSKLMVFFEKLYALCRKASKVVCIESVCIESQESSLTDFVHGICTK